MSPSFRAKRSRRTWSDMAVETGRTNAIIQGQKTSVVSSDVIVANHRDSTRAENIILTLDHADDGDNNGSASQSSDESRPPDQQGWPGEQQEVSNEDAQRHCDGMNIYTNLVQVRDRTDDTSKSIGKRANSAAESG